MAERADATRREAATLADAPARLDADIAGARDALARAGEAVTRAAEAEGAAVVRLKAAETRLAAVTEAVAMAREARATAAARVDNQEARRIEMGRISGERFQCPAAVLPATAGFEPAAIGEVSAESARFDRLTADRERLGPVNLVAEAELATIDRERTTQVAERDELAQAVHQLRGSIGSLNREGRQRLTAAFEAVDGHFRRLFARLFGGGEAHLALIDSDDPLEAGLEIMAQPPGKKLASLTLLSGGEQALTACALIFALFLTAPAPICVLDEDRSGPRQGVFLDGPQHRAGLNEVRRHAHARRRRPQRPQDVRHQRSAAGPEFHEGQRIRPPHRAVDVGGPGPDQLAEHLADLGRRGEIALGAEGIARPVVAVNWMAEAESHVAIDADRPVLADQGCDLGSEGRHASAGASRASPAAGASTGWRGRVRPVAASTM
jgi:hypothetical protein